MAAIHTFARNWLPVCILCAGIFFQSSYAVPDVGPQWPPFTDKVAHGLVYALLSALICRAFNGLPRWQGRNRHLVVAGTLLATLYGLSDEVHQAFIISRTADPADLLADFIGSVTGALSYIVLLGFHKHIKGQEIGKR